jgi:hypothetical protein
MHLAVLSCTFQLPGCSSLKEKRQRLLGLKDKFGKTANIAVSEANYHDNHRRAEWHFAVMSQDKTIVEQQLAHIEQYASTELDALVEDMRREWL